MYKHLEGDYTGEIVLKVKADANPYLVMNNIASHCRIPDNQFVVDPDRLARPEERGQHEKEIHFTLTWQRVDAELSEIRRRFFEAITKIPVVADAFVELVKFDVLTAEQVLQQRAEKARQAPPPRLARLDAA